jgi:hypothetical protein
MMKKAEINALGRVFAAEVNGRLPYQSKSRIFTELQAAGLVAPVEYIFPGRFLVKGWQLTHAGRYFYCSQC